MTPAGSGVGRGVGRWVTPGGSGVGGAVGAVVGCGVGGAVGAGVGVGAGLGAVVTTRVPPLIGDGFPGGSSTTTALNVTVCVPAGSVSDPAYVPFVGLPDARARGTVVAPACASIESGGRAGAVLTNRTLKVNSVAVVPESGGVTDGLLRVLAPRTGSGARPIIAATRTSAAQAGTRHLAKGRAGVGTNRAASRGFQTTHHHTEPPA